MVDQVEDCYEYFYWELWNYSNSSQFKDVLNKNFHKRNGRSRPIERIFAKRYIYSKL